MLRGVCGDLGYPGLSWAGGNHDSGRRLGWEVKSVIVRRRVVVHAGMCRESIDGREATRCLQPGTPLFLIILRSKAAQRMTTMR